MPSSTSFNSLLKLFRLPGKSSLALVDHTWLAVSNPNTEASHKGECAAVCR